ncbi:hypothetical protein LOY87_001408 [Ophidiomyces ophidiicola]|nr:hypothetical protein LOY87_001408 [Ophidiomyces ophidiicola]
MDASQSKEDRLAELSSLASAKAAIKDYNTAADLYSQAAELQADVNGEMAVENADLLYLYGKCLYYVAVSNSDVLGSKAAVQTAVDSGKPPGKESATTLCPDNLPGPQKTSAPTDTTSTTDVEKSANTAFFQFTGDENFEDDEEEDEGNDEAEGPAEEDDDFENAFETLDMSRVLSLRKLEILSQSSEDQGDDDVRLAEVRKVKLRLSDIYDLQAEISLEGERFKDAVADLWAALDLKRELCAPEDSAIAECHYKLSLALEFSSITRTSDDNESGPSQIDLNVREEAVEQMKAAIQCCKLRISIEEKKLADLDSTESQEAAKLNRYLDDVKDIVSDMEQRLIELRRPPQKDEDDTVNKESIIVQSQMTGSKVSLGEAMKSANDLSSLVRKRKRVSAATEAQPSEGESAPSKQTKQDPA